MKYLKLFENKWDETVDTSKEDAEEVNYENKLLQTIKKDVDSLIDNINQAIESGDIDNVINYLNGSIGDVDNLLLDISQTYLNELKEHIHNFPFTEKIGGAIDDFIINIDAIDPVEHFTPIIWDEILDRIDYDGLIEIMTEDPTTYKELSKITKNSSFIKEVFNRINDKLPDWIKRGTKANLWDLKK